VYSKKCIVYNIAIVMGEEPMDHDACVRNYRTRSSKAMNASTALQLIFDLYSRGFVVVYCI